MMHRNDTALRDPDEVCWGNGATRYIARRPTIEERIVIGADGTRWMRTPPGQPTVADLVAPGDRIHNFYPGAAAREMVRRWGIRYGVVVIVHRQAQCVQPYHMISCQPFDAEEARWCYHIPAWSICYIDEPEFKELQADHPKTWHQIITRRRYDWGIVNGLVAVDGKIVNLIGGDWGEKFIIDQRSAYLWPATQLSML